MKKVGKPVNIEGINAKALQSWLNKEPKRREAIKCQALISLTKGVSVTDVCRVLGKTRETISEWRKKLIKEGLSYLDRVIIRGRQTGLTTEIQKLIKKCVLKPPTESGYKQAVWDGKLLCKLLYDRENINISVRTSQYWLKKIGFTLQRPRLKYKKASKKEKMIFKEGIKKT